MSWPSRDPAVPHPGKVFCEGQWRTPEAAQRKYDLKEAARIEREDPEWAAYLRGEISREDLQPLPPLPRLEEWAA